MTDRETFDHDTARLIVRLCFFVAAVFSVGVIVLSGFHPFLIWLFAGCSFLVAIAFLLMDILERAGYKVGALDWLFMDMVVLVWVMVLALLGGIENGLSVRLSTLCAVAILFLAVVAFQYLKHIQSRLQLTETRYKSIAAVLVVVILCAGALLWVPSPRLVIIDWPCREAEWKFKDTEAAWKDATDYNYLDPNLETLGHQTGEALIDWETCLGRDSAALRKFLNDS